jgi:hypothetical protein
MKSQTSESSGSLLRDPTDFSLVQGGPLFQLFRRSHLSDNALELVRLRVIVISLVAWLPLWKDRRWAGARQYRKRMKECKRK